MKPKEYIIKNLSDLSEISNKIRLDMLKNILELPLLMFIDNVGEWVSQYGFKLEQKFISFETKALNSLIEILDKKFKDWQKSESKYKHVDNLGKVNSSLSTPFENVIVDHNSELQKYQILQVLASLNDVEAIKLYDAVQFIIDYGKSGSEMKSKIPEKLLSSTPKPEEIISMISKNYSFDKFIWMLNKEISSTQIKGKVVDLHFLKRKIIIKRENLLSKTNLYKLLNEELIKKNGIKPINIIQIYKEVFIALSIADYFAVKHGKILKYFHHLIHNLKFTLLKEENTLLAFIDYFFPDAHLDFHFDEKKKVLSIKVEYVSVKNQIELEVINTLINKYVIFPDPVEFEFVRKKLISS